MEDERPPQGRPPDGWSWCDQSAGSGEAAVGRRERAARTGGSRRLQDLRLPDAVLEVAVRHLGLGARTGRRGLRGRRRPGGRGRLPPVRPPRWHALGGRDHHDRRTSGRRSRGARAASSRPTPTDLAGIFGDAAWANKERLPETSLVNLLQRLPARCNLDPDARVATTCSAGPTSTC